MTTTNNSKIPDPTILWQGKTIEGIPVRIVRTYAVRTEPKPEKISTHIFLETAPSVDAMKQPLWVKKSTGDIPNSFWEDRYPE